MVAIFAVHLIAHVKIYGYDIGTIEKNNVIPMHRSLEPRYEPKILNQVCDSYV